MNFRKWFGKKPEVSFEEPQHGECATYVLSREGNHWATVRVTFRTIIDFEPGFLEFDIRSADYEAKMMFPRGLNDDRVVDMTLTGLNFERGDRVKYEEERSFLFAFLGNMLMCRLSESSEEISKSPLLSGEFGCGISEAHRIETETPYLKTAFVSPRIPVIGLASYREAAGDKEMKVVSYGFDPFTGGKSNQKESAYDVSRLATVNYASFELTHPESWFFAKIPNRESEEPEQLECLGAISGGDTACITCIVEIYKATLQEVNQTLPIAEDAKRYQKVERAEKSEEDNSVFVSVQQDSPGAVVEFSVICATAARSDSGMAGTLRIAGACSRNNAYALANWKMAQDVCIEIAQSFVVLG